MTSQDAPDQLLISRYLEGNEDAFEVLYERYHKAIYAYLHKLLPGQSALIDDTFQKTWLKVIRYLPRYQDQNNFLSWTIKISRNLAYDHFRKDKGDVEFSEENDARSKEFIPGSNLVHNEMGEAIAEAVEALPLEQREVFQLRQEGISFKEIAAIQQTSLNTTLGRMHYAVNRLRGILKDWL